jgi:hypothetical protein
MVCPRLLQWVLLAWGALCGAAFGGSGPDGNSLSPAELKDLTIRRAILLQQGGAVAPPPLAPSAPALLPPVAPPAEPLGGSPAPRGLAYPRPAPTLPQGMTMTIDKIFSDKADAGPKPASHSIVLPRQAARQLAACWTPPLPERGDTVEVTLRFAFDRGGSVLWPPRITYVKPGQGASAKEVRESILSAFKACTPLPFSASMAASMPGYPLTVRFIGRRGE